MSENRTLLEDNAGSGKEATFENQQQCLDVGAFPPTSPGVTEDLDNDAETGADAADRETDEDKQRSQLGETIERLRGNLMSIVDVRHGLLDELRALDVITSQQIEEIESKSTTDSRVDQLLNLVLKTPDAYERFLVALDNNQQVHITEYIRAKGKVGRLNREMRPLRYCSELKMLEKNRVKLIDLIDLRCGLLDELFADDCINERQMQSIEAGQTEADQNTRLLNVLILKSFGDLKRTIDCLIRTKQWAVVRLMSESYTCNDEPLSDKKRLLLKRNRAKLISCIDSGCGLLVEMSGVDCISERQKQFIEAGISQADRNSRLLDIMRRASESDFSKFLECLSETGQSHLASILREDSVVMPVDAVTSAGADEETLIAERFIALLSTSLSHNSDTEKKSIYAKVIERLNEMRSRDIHTIYVQKQNSIGVFYLCHSLDGLQHLFDLFFSKELEKTLECIFTLLLDSGKPVVVHRLRWDVQDHMNGLRCLYSKVSLNMFSELYELASDTRLGLADRTVYSLCIDQYPFELLQEILIKAVGQWFLTIHRVTSLAPVYAVASLCAVSALWWRTLTHRPHNKRVLARYFRYVCSPFKCSPQRLHGVSVENVFSITEFNGKLYVGVGSSASVQVFVSRPPFIRLADVKVQGLSNPSDMVVCIETSRLFIVDCGCQYIIWRLNLLHDQPADKFITMTWRPWCVSLNTGRLLITPDDGDALFVYNGDGNQLNHIELPRYMRALHAVETKPNIYIVCHRSRWTGDTTPEHSGVSEVDFNGRVVRAFNSQHIDMGSVKFNCPRYMVLYGDHVIVADRYSERVVVLKSDLQLKRVLIPSLGGIPMRLCISKSTGLLFIRYLQSSNIDVYQVTSAH